jgi:hypothetical protein
MLKKIGFIAIGMLLVSLLFAATINGVIDIPEVTVASNPPSGWWRLFFKTDGKLYKRNSAGTETEIGSGGGGGGANTIIYRSAGVIHAKGAWGYRGVIPGMAQATLPAMGAGNCLVVEWYAKDGGGVNNGDMALSFDSGAAVPVLASPLYSAANFRFTLCNNPGSINAQQWTEDRTNTNGSMALDFSNTHTLDLAFGGGSDCYIDIKQVVVRSLQ